MFATLVNLFDRVAPVVIAKGAEVPWSKAGMSAAKWNEQGEAMFADFEHPSEQHQPTATHAAS
jgi:hypothetical protein